MERTTYISVVIPTYNEQARIADTLYDVKNYLAQKSYNSEIIVVDDGSVDTTAEVVRVIDIYQQEFKQQPSCVIVSNYTNSGKGFSVAKGCREANGKYVLFMDADASTPITEIEKLLPLMEQGNDIVIGRRSDQANRRKPWQRRIGSWLFNTSIRVLGLSSQRDTQCGFKLYRNAAVRKIIAHQTVARWCFDVEHLHLAEKLSYSIASVPVEWVHRGGSKIRWLRDSKRTLIELIRIRLAHRSKLTPGNLLSHK